LLFLLKRCLVIAGVRAGSQARDDLTWVTMDAQALEMCSQCLLLLEECSELSAVQEMNQSIEDWLQKTIGRVDALLMEVCRKFEAEKYATVINAYTLLDDVTSLAEKVQSFYAQLVFSETHDVIKNLLFQVCR
jgi:hypothetical protein